MSEEMSQHEQFWSIVFICCPVLLCIFNTGFFFMGVFNHNQARFSHFLGLIFTGVLWIYSHHKMIEVRT